MHALLYEQKQINAILIACICARLKWVEQVGPVGWLAWLTYLTSQRAISTSICVWPSSGSWLLRLFWLSIFWCEKSLVLDDGGAFEHADGRFDGAGEQRHPGCEIIVGRYPGACLPECFQDRHQPGCPQALVERSRPFSSCSSQLANC